MIHFPDTPEDFVANRLNCNSWVATAVVGAAAVGGAAKIFAAKTAADAQTGAAGAAGATLKEAALHAQNSLEYHNNIAQSYLQPYRDLGQKGVDELGNRISSLTTPIPVSQEQLDLQKPLNIDQATLETLPGYQFTKTQGLKAVSNSAAARGLGVSGAALKGAATFTTGLADSTYRGQFETEMTNRQAAFGRYGQVWQQQQQGQQTAYDRLMGIINAGETAGAVGGTLEQKTGQGIATSLTTAGTGVAGTQIGAGNAEAAATNAIGGAVSDVANSVGGYAAYKGLYGGAGSPNMSFVKGSAGDMYVPTFGK